MPVNGHIPQKLEMRSETLHDAFIAEYSLQKAELLQCDVSGCVHSCSFSEAVDAVIVTQKCTVTLQRKTATAYVNNASQTYSDSDQSHSLYKSSWYPHSNHNTQL